MEFYALGTFPEQAPAWFSDVMAPMGADASRIPVWHLGTAGPEGCTTFEIFSALEGMFRLVYEDADGSVREADIRKGEIPPDYVPLPTDGDARLEPD